MTSCYIEQEHIVRYYGRKFFLVL